MITHEVYEVITMSEDLEGWYREHTTHIYGTSPKIVLEKYINDAISNGTIYDKEIDFATGECLAPIFKYIKDHNFSKDSINYIINTYTVEDIITQLNKCYFPEICCNNKAPMQSGIKIVKKRIDIHTE